MSTHWMGGRGGDMLLSLELQGYQPQNEFCICLKRVPSP